MPQFLAPQIKTIGAVEVGELNAMASAASDHSSGMYMVGDGSSVSDTEAIEVSFLFCCTLGMPVVFNMR